MLSHTVSDNRNLDLILIIEAAVEHLELEWQLLLSPNRFSVIEPDVPVLLVGKVCDWVGQPCAWRSKVAL